MFRQVTNEMLDDIVYRYKDTVYRIAYMRMKQKSDADDIFQEVFLKLVQHISSIQSEEHLKAWLIRVTINCCKNHYLSGWLKNVVYYDDTRAKDLEDHYGGGLSYDEVESNSFDAGYDPFETQESFGLTTENLYDAVASLSAKYRDVIHLFYYEELPIKIIAVILSLSEGSVKTRLSRARDILRKRLKGEMKYEQSV